MRSLAFLAGTAVVLAGAAVAQTAKPMHHPETRAEVGAKVREMFAKADANKDGFVTEAEMKAAHEARAEHRDERRAERAQGMFDRLDANKDGVLSRDEFAKGQDRRREWRAAHKGAGGRHAMRGMMGAHMLAMGDADKDGKVSLKEAEAMALHHFDEVDSNRDGRISDDERKAMHLKMRDKMRAMHHDKKVG